MVPRSRRSDGASEHGAPNPATVARIPWPLAAVGNTFSDRIEGSPRPGGRGYALALHKHFARADVDQVRKRLAARLVGNHRDVSDGAGTPAAAIGKADPRPYRDWAAVTHRGAARKQSLQ